MANAPPRDASSSTLSTGLGGANASSSKLNSRDAPDEPTSEVKRGRRSNPKVKTGCFNCKQRRIKCDERRPECTQCMRSGKSCTGYPPPSRTTRALAEIRLAPKPLPSIQPSPGLGTSRSVVPVVLQTAAVLPPRRPRRRRRQQLIVAELAAINTSPTVYQPSDLYIHDNLTRYYFELFRSHTASQLSGYFDANFWQRRVLQECHSGGAIHHAVLALGALYKTLDQSCEKTSSETPDSVSRYESITMHWQVAVKQYSEACNAMLLVNGADLESYRTRLMATILLACFDSFIGDHKQAIIQIQTGLGLLEQYRTEQQGYASCQNGQIEEDLVVLFTRLAIQAKSYDMAFHFPHPYVIQFTRSKAAPSSPASDRSSPSSLGSPECDSPFTSLLEARSASDKLIEALILFLERLQMSKSDPSYVLPASWKRYGMAFKERLNAWSEAFEPIFQSRFTPGLSYLERCGIAALKMSQVNANVLFLMMFCDNEVQFDSFMPHFKAIVDLGWEVVGEDERRAAAAQRPNSSSCKHRHSPTKGGFKKGKYPPGHIKPSFSADMGIVPPLFVVASKCRDPMLRRQAIQLLRSSARREGMWDSELAANICTWVMQVEEFDDRSPEATLPAVGSGEYLYSDSRGIAQRTIPEERRVMIKSVDFDLRARFADLQVGTRAAHKGAQSQDMRFRQTRINW